MTEVTVPTAPPLATIPGVDLIRTGQWNLSTGPVTFTSGDLAAAVAAVGCPAVRSPILKLGHTDPRFDGEPAVGYVANMTLAAGGHTIVGDYTGMPGWLGDVIASAYPDRSIEGFFDWHCQLGHTHPFVITAVALLGVEHPGVGTLSSLQDVATLYGVTAANNTASGMGEPVAVTIHARRDTMPNPRPAKVAAAVTSEDVRRAYYQNAPWAEWICEIQLDPLQLIIVDDESGKYYRQPVAVDGEDNFTFGDKVEVRIRYEDVTAPTGAQPASPAAASASVIVFASRAESRPGSTVRAATVSDKPWSDFSAADYDIDQWKKACLIDTGEGDATSKDRYKVPVLEPDGTLNRNGCHAAAGAHGISAVTGISDDDKKSAAKKLVGLYKDELDEDPPEGLLKLAGMDAPANAAASSGRPPARPARAAQNPPADPAGASPQEGAAMDAAKLREALGLSPEASDDEVRTALTENGLAADAPAPGGDNDPAPAGEPGDGGEPAGEGDGSGSEGSGDPGVQAGADTTRPLPPGTVAIDESTLAQLRRDAQQGVEARALQRRQDRDRVLDDAIRAGKFPPARRDHWAAYWDRDEEGARAAIGSLADGLVPVEDLGQPGGEPTDALDAEYDRLFPPTVNARS